MRQEWFLGLSQKKTSGYRHDKESRRLMYMSCFYCYYDYVYYYLVLLVKYLDKNKLWIKHSMSKDMNEYCHGEQKAALLHILKYSKKMKNIKEFLNLYLDLSVKCESILDLKTVQNAIQFCQENQRKVRPELQTILENYINTHYPNSK